MIHQLDFPCKISIVIHCLRHKGHMMIKKVLTYCKEFLMGLLLKEHSPKKLAMAFSLGVYIAFSPFPGFHTAMVFVLSWLCGLNVAAVLASSCLINNPWTMIPVYMADYVFGNWLCCTFLGTNMIGFNPAWMNGMAQWLCQTTGLAHISLASFLIGGNVLGIGLAFLLYPIMRYIFSTLAQEAQGLLHKKTVLK